ncbi:MAG: PAS domain S-box protein [Elusimicrobia bacterium]|nr:PAS domain S-box protein [Elusimicrobiota bacterium]
MKPETPSPSTRTPADLGEPARPSAAAVLAGTLRSKELEIQSLRSEVAALQERERELTDFLENGSIGLHWVDGNGITLWANQSELDLLGYTREEYVGKPIADFHADKRVIADILRRLAANETLIDYEARLIHKDGSTRNVLINSNVFRKDGKFVHTRCFTRDITERKQLESRYLALFETTDDGIMIVNDAGVYVDVNESMCRILKTTRAALVGQRFGEFIPADRMADAEEAFRQLTATGRYKGQFPLKAADGTLVDLDWRSRANFAPGLHVSVARDITDQKRDQQYLSMALNAAKMVAWEWDLVTNTVRTSENFPVIYGRAEVRTPEEGFRLVHPDDVRAHRAVVERAMAERTPYRSQFRILLPGGQVKWIEEIASGTYDAAGRMRKLSGVVVDVTERKLADEALRDALEFDSAVMANLGEGLYTVDAEGRVTSLNPAGEKMFGWTFDELRGRRMHDVTHHSKRDGSRYPIEECAGFSVMRSGQTIRNFADTFIRKDGTFFDVIYSSAPIRRDGKVVGLVVVFRDVTETRRIEEAALHRAAVVESSPDAIYTESVDGIVTSWNRGAERIYGFTEAEALGRHISAVIVPPNRREECERLTERVLAGERIANFETERRRKDGGIIPVSLAVSGIRDTDGRMVGVSKIARDISGHKQYERRLLEQAKELEQFAYISSHDLKEPLRKISNYAQLLDLKTTGGVDPEARRCIDNIVSGTERMNNLIEALLSYSRIDHSDNAEPTDLNEVVRTVLSDLESTIVEAGATVTCGPLPVVMGDKTHMQQLLQNLVGNALKFRGAAAPWVQITAESDGRHHRITVADNGIGIAPEYHDQIFKVFQRLHGSGRYPGTGIGLAICKKIADKYGGSISLSSQEGQGAAFTVTLPAIHAG